MPSNNSTGPPEQQDDKVDLTPPLKKIVGIHSGILTPEEYADGYLKPRCTSFARYKEMGGVVEASAHVLDRLGHGRDSAMAMSVAECPYALYMPGKYGYGVGIFLKMEPFSRQILGTKLAPPSYKFQNDVILFGEDGDNVIDCEGHVKALAVHDAIGFTTIGNGGINGAGKSEQSTRFHTERKHGPGKDYVLYDSLQPSGVTPDLDRKRNAQLAAEHTRALLSASQGRTPYIVRLPPPPPLMQITQWDVNDYLRHFGPEALKKLIASAVKYRLPEMQELVVLDSKALRAMEPPLFLVDGMLISNEDNLIYGEPSCGKSTNALDLAMKVAGPGIHPDHQCWNGAKINKHGPVVFLAQEGNGIGARVQAFYNHYEVTEDYPIYVIPTPVEMTKDADRIIARIHELGIEPVLTVVDTVNRTYTGDENSNSDMGEYLRSSTRVRHEFEDSCMAFLHHAGKNKDAGARGASAMPAWVGGVIFVEDNSGVHTITVEKVRDAQKGGQFNFKLTPVDIGKGRTACVCEPTLSVSVSMNRTYEVSDRTDRQGYGWIYLWATKEKPGETITRNALKKNWRRILPKQSGWKQKDLLAAFEGAINKKWCTLAGKSERNEDGEEYLLHPPPEEKY